MKLKPMEIEVFKVLFNQFKKKLNIYLELSF